MRQVVLDTETTGLDPKGGHRVIEIGAVEMMNRRITGNHFHRYINPEREVEAEALNVHNITNEFLQDKPLFNEVKSDFFDFIRGAELIIHNAPFDLGFLDMELQRCDPQFTGVIDHCSVFDTLVFARKMHPGQRNSLDALCKRYHVDNSSREWHGALLDAEILARLYLAMTGGQASLLFEEERRDHQLETDTITQLSSRKKQASLRVIYANSEELAEHEAMLNLMEGKKK